MEEAVAKYPSDRAPTTALRTVAALTTANFRQARGLAGRRKHIVIITRMTGAWVLSGFLLCSVAGGADSSYLDNPYHQISERNVFGLKSPQPIEVAPPSGPLPRITLTGITTILGDKRALLKIMFPAQPSRPAKEQSVILSEGQRDGAIEVLEIDAKTAKVKVSVSGIVSVVTFEKPGRAPSPAMSPTAPHLRPFWPRPPIQAGVR